MRVHGFHHLAIQVRDLETAASFYEKVLGLEEQARHLRPDGSLRSIWLSLEGGGFLALEACKGELQPAPFRSDRPGLHLLALRIDREARARAVEELARAGVAIEHQTRWTVYFRDPEGNRIALSHHPEDPAG